MRYLLLAGCVPALACLLLWGCGGEEEAAPAPAPAALGPPEWQRAEVPGVGGAIQIRTSAPCFVRFRVEGASDAPHS